MQPSATVIGAGGTTTGRRELPASIFARAARIPLLHQVVVAEQAAARRGTHSTKTRAEVSGGGAKPFRQKGTGNARQGSIRAPQFRGGGIVHGPRPRSHAHRLPKKMVAGALCEALSDRALAGAIYVLESAAIPEISTRTGAAVLRGADLASSLVLVVTGEGDGAMVKSLRNLVQVRVVSPGSLLTSMVLVSDAVVCTEAGLAGLLRRLDRTGVEIGEVVA
ncbi:MAG: 50S ribosomal protein L4 [Ferrimicrobium sp.]